ncbi:prostaglandin E2 receptor EP4 subtype-like isoform X4 [Scylla paramamosain]|uniref:prostaglandin E2 receptor EP4 subtype-like isoform X4 n=1 Tax=Scylla paramamosain TaxID=85552 RepID=UPI003082C9E1
MLPPPEEVVSDAREGVTQAVPLGCNCGGEEVVAMTDTLLQVECEANVTCTALTTVPGATIVSPILLSLSGVTGQIWALYYLYTSTRPQHSRTVFFLLLSTLIWTDLVGKVITTTPALIAYVYGGWVGGKPLCNFHGFSMMLISLVTHLLVSTMAVERFIGIRHGYFYNKNITTTRTKILLLGIWLFSVLFCAMPLFGLGQYALQYPGSWCFVNIHVTPASPLRHRIYTNVFGLFTLINLLIMVVCNIVVITTLLCLRLCRQRCCGKSICQPQRSYRQRELEMQMVIVLLVITIVFLISWSPIDMRLFLNQIWPHKTRADHLQDLIAVRLTSINQIIDPWAYIICRKVFVTRAWRWMRLSLMGSRFLGRENSSHPGSSKKAMRPPEKPLYRPAFKGARWLQKVVKVVGMKETKT